MPESISGEFSGVTVVEGLSELLEEYLEAKDLILTQDSIKAGLLVFADKTELTSMGLLDASLDSDLSIRIVPVLHGG